MSVRVRVSGSAPAAVAPSTPLVAAAAAFATGATLGFTQGSTLAEALEEGDNQRRRRPSTVESMRRAGLG